jgi:DNA-binding transcriptional LysR family regulator
MNIKITLDGLRVLDAIDRRGSFAAAASELFRVTSALTYSVQKLESDLGIALFERQGKKSLLTAAGRSLLDDGRKLLQAAEAMENRAKRISTGWEAELRIALDTLLPISTLTPLVRQFDQIDCGTELRISEEVFGGSWDALATGRCDLAIGAAGEGPSGGGYRHQVLLQLEMVFATAPDHPLAELRQPLSEADIERYRAVVVADSSRQLLPRTSNVLAAQSRLVVHDLTAKCEMQIAGLGVGSLPRVLAEQLEASGQLKILQLEVPLSPIEMNFAWRADNKGRALSWFVKNLAANSLQLTEAAYALMPIPRLSNDNANQNSAATKPRIIRKAVVTSMSETPIKP